MNKLKVLIGVVIALVVINVALVATFAMLKGKQGNRPNPKEIIIKQLGFDQTQIESYEVLIEEHRKKMQSHEKEIKELKQSLFSSLSKSDSFDAPTVTKQIATHQEQIELAHYNHFSQLKALCKEEQMLAFTALSEDLSELFGPKHPRKPRP